MITRGKKNGGRIMNDKDVRKGSGKGKKKYE